LTGTFTPPGSSFTAVGKSPLTGTWGNSRAGGYFGAELKSTGFDAVFCYGRASNPVYLSINDGKVEIKDEFGGRHLETESILREKFDDERIQVVSIGPSGKKLSLMSCIITDKGRAAGRSGLGALTGSKNLKTVAVRGTMQVPLFSHQKSDGAQKKVY